MNLSKSCHRQRDFFLSLSPNQYCHSITRMMNSPLYTCQSCLPIKFRSAVSVPFHAICLWRSASDGAWLKNDSFGLKTDRDGKMCERIHQACVLSLRRVWDGWLVGWAGHVSGRITPLWACIYQPNCHVMTLRVTMEHQSISSWHDAAAATTTCLIHVHVRRRRDQFATRNHCSGWAESNGEYWPQRWLSPAAAAAGVNIIGADRDTGPLSGNNVSWFWLIRPRCWCVKTNYCQAAAVVWSVSASSSTK